MTPQPEPDQYARRISGEPIAWTSPDGVKHMSDIMMEKFALELSRKDAEIGNIMNALNDHGKHWEAIADALGIPCLAGMDCDPKTALSNAAVCVEKVNSLAADLAASRKLNEELRGALDGLIYIVDNSGEVLHAAGIGFVPELNAANDAMRL